MILRSTLPKEPISAISTKPTSVIDIGFTSPDVFMSVEFISEGSTKFSADVLKPGTYTITPTEANIRSRPGRNTTRPDGNISPSGTGCRVIGMTDTYGFATSGTITVEKVGQPIYHNVRYDVRERQSNQSGAYTGALFPHRRHRKTRNQRIGGGPRGRSLRDHTRETGPIPAIGTTTE